jgi:alpha,alpha-trehalose phosphorylase
MLIPYDDELGVHPQAEGFTAHLAHRCLTEAARVDLEDLDQNTRDGLHIASLAGAWIGAVAGFGGMRDRDGILSFTPRLPPWIDVGPAALNATRGW